MTFAELNQEIKETEGRLCPGSETPLLGHFRTRMAALVAGETRKADPDDICPEDECDWWRKAYELYEADQERGRGWNQTRSKISWISVAGRKNVSRKTLDTPFNGDYQIQHDASGQGHCWRNISPDELPPITLQQIEEEIIDGGREEGSIIASNGLHYRWSQA